MSNLVLILLMMMIPLSALSKSLSPVMATAGIMKVTGFEVMPPKGEFWFSYDEMPPGQVTFRKQDLVKKSLVGGAHHSFVVEIKAEIYRDYDLTTKSGLEAALKFALLETPEKYDYAVPSLEQFRWQNTDCIRYAMSRQEPESLQGKQVRFVWDVRGYFCRHPFDPAVAVTGLYQERRLSETPSMLNDSLRNEVEQVLESVRFRSME